MPAKGIQVWTQSYWIKNIPGQLSAAKEVKIIQNDYFQYLEIGRLLWAGLSRQYPKRARSYTSMLLSEPLLTGVSKINVLLRQGANRMTRIICPYIRPYM